MVGMKTILLSFMNMIKDSGMVNDILKIIRVV
jgi:hypothetical protein